MDDKLINRNLRPKIQKKFYGHNKLYSKYEMKIPESAEREYIRLVRSYMGILKQAMHEELPKLKDTYKTERDSMVAYRTDGVTDLDLAVTDVCNIRPETQASEYSHAG